MDIAHIDWIPEGTRFGEEEMAYFAGRGERDVDDALADIDLVVTGRHQRDTREAVITRRQQRQPCAQLGRPVGRSPIPAHRCRPMTGRISTLSTKLATLRVNASRYGEKR